MKIYTKTGDEGETTLFGGGRVPKDDVRIETCGTIDELNSMVGVCRSANSVKAIDTILAEVQFDLFTFGSDIATPQNITMAKRVDEMMITRLENHIDAIEPQLENLKNFIIPGGNRCSALLHLTRAVCRRAERSVVRLARREKIGKFPLMYLNRLSDLLFLLARWSNALSNTTETKWISD